MNTAHTYSINGLDFSITIPRSVAAMSDRNANRLDDMAAWHVGIQSSGAYNPQTRDGEIVEIDGAHGTPLTHLIAHYDPFQ